MLKFIDLFAGIGGFHLAFHNVGAECVFVSEIDKSARATYKHNLQKISPNIFKEDDSELNLFNDDIRTVEPKNIPDHDILCAGFPCQPFSQAGHKKGFEEDRDDRGNMFFILRDIYI